ncbi:MAG: hypothetical protein ACRD3B_18870 [Candidatus Sulfotelmatobacter sp.]
MKTLSTVARLTICNLVIFAVMELLFGTAVWFTLRRNLYDLVDHRVEGQVEDLKRFLRSQSNDMPLDQLQQQMKEKFGKERAGDYLELFLDKGDLVYRSASLQENSAALLAPGQVKRPTARSRKIADRRFRFFFQKISVDGRLFIVEMGTPADDAVETLHQFRFRMLLAGVLLWIVAAFPLHSILRRIVVP